MSLKPRSNPQIISHEKGWFEDLQHSLTYTFHYDPFKSCPLASKKYLLFLVVYAKLFRFLLTTVEESKSTSFQVNLKNRKWNPMHQEQYLVLRIIRSFISNKCSWLFSVLFSATMQRFKLWLKILSSSYIIYRLS